MVWSGKTDTQNTRAAGPWKNHGSISALPHLETVGLNSEGTLLSIFIPLQEAGNAWEKGQPWLGGQGLLSL